MSRLIQSDLVPPTCELLSHDVIVYNCLFSCAETFTTACLEMTCGCLFLSHFRLSGCSVICQALWDWGEGFRSELARRCCIQRHDTLVETRTCWPFANRPQLAPSQSGKRIQYCRSSFGNSKTPWSGRWVTCSWFVTVRRLLYATVCNMVTVTSKKLLQPMFMCVLMST